MPEIFYTIITTVGLAKLANAQATGSVVNLATIKAGDSGGNYRNPAQADTNIVGEVWSSGINQITTDDDNPNWLIIEGVIPTDVGGFHIREVGVFDDQGDLIAIGKYPETYKPTLAAGSGKDLYIRMILEMSSTAQVTLKINPAIVLASRQYVATAIDAEIAAHNADEDPHPQYATDLDLATKADLNGDAAEIFRAATAEGANDVPPLGQVLSLLAATPIDGGSYD